MSRLYLFGPLCATAFLVNLSRVAFAPLLQPVAAEFDVGVASLGVVASAVWLGSAVPRLPTGYLLTRVPRHHVVVATGALLVLTSAFTGFAGSITHLTLGAFLMGLSSGIYFVSAMPLISELFPRRIGRVVGVHGMAEQVAAVSAPLVVGGILLFGEWRQTFFVITGAAAVVTLLIVAGVRSVDLPRGGEADRSLSVAVRSQWPRIVTCLFAVGLVGFLWNGLFNLYGDYLATVKGIEPGTGRLLLSLMFAAGIPAWLVAGTLADRVRNVPMMAAILLGFGAGVVGLTVADGIVLIAAFSVISGYLFFSLPPVLDTYLLSSLPDEHRGSSYAVYSSIMMVLIASGSGGIGTTVGLGYRYDVVLRVLAGAVVVNGTVLLALFRSGVLPGDAGR